MHNSTILDPESTVELAIKQQQQNFNNYILVQFLDCQNILLKMYILYPESYLQNVILNTVVRDITREVKQSWLIETVTPKIIFPLPSRHTFWDTNKQTNKQRRMLQYSQTKKQTKSQHIWFLFFYFDFCHHTLLLFQMHSFIAHFIPWNFATLQTKTSLLLFSCKT